MIPPGLPGDKNSSRKHWSNPSLDEVRSAIEYVKASHENKADSFPIQAAAQKISLLHRAVDEVNTLLQHRRELQNDIRSEISAQMCKLRSLQYELENAGADPSDRISLRRHISDLSKEQWHSEVEFFRDNFMLFRELRKSESEFVTAILPFYAVSVGKYSSIKMK